MDLVEDLSSDNIECVKPILKKILEGYLQEI